MIAVLAGQGNILSSASRRMMMQWILVMVVGWAFVISADPVMAKGCASHNRNSFRRSRSHNFLGTIDETRPLTGSHFQRMPHRSAAVTSRPVANARTSAAELSPPHNAGGKEKILSAMGFHDDFDPNSSQFPLHGVKFVRYPPKDTDLTPGSTYPLEFCQRWEWSSLTYAFLSRKSLHLDSQVKVVLRRIRETEVTQLRTKQHILLNSIRIDEVMEFNNGKFRRPRIDVVREKFPSDKDAAEPLPQSDRWYARLGRWLRFLFRPKDIYLRQFQLASSTKNQSKMSYWRCYTGAVQLPDTLPTGMYFLAVEGLPNTHPFSPGPYVFSVNAAGTSNDLDIPRLEQHYSKDDKIMRILHVSLGPRKIAKDNFQNDGDFFRESRRPDYFDDPHSAIATSSTHRFMMLSIIIETPDDETARLDFKVALQARKGSGFFLQNQVMLNVKTRTFETMNTVEQSGVEMGRPLASPSSDSNLVTIDVPITIAHHVFDQARQMVYFSGSLTKKIGSGWSRPYDLNTFLHLRESETDSLEPLYC